MVEEKIVKIDEENVVIIKEARSVYSKKNLETQKAHLVANMAEIDRLLAAFAL